MSTDIDFIDETTIGYVNIALNICGFNFKKQHVETILQVLKAVNESEGEVSIRDIAKIEAQMERKYQIKDADGE